MSTTVPSHQAVETYYDEHITGKLHGYVLGSVRTDAAWETLTSNILSAPRTILEVGCGIGDIAYRMHRYWPEAHVTGLDISPKSIEVANKLFSNERLHFVAGILDDQVFAGKKFDLIILVDVYEHISNDIREAFDKTMGNILSDTGVIFMAFPTPKLQAYLKKNHPDQMQPVDEDINVHTIAALAAHTATDVIVYKEVKVWARGDYAHAFLCRPEKEWDGVAPLGSMQTRITRGIKKLIRNNNFLSTKKSRTGFVKKKLGNITI